MCPSAPRAAVLDRSDSEREDGDRAHVTELRPVHPGSVVRQARRNGALAAVAVAVIVAVIALVGSAILITLGVLTIILGIVLCLTGVGIVLGIPLILVGWLAVVGGVIGGSGGVLLALVLGAGSGFVFYRFRLRSVSRRSNA